jgi:lipoprotein-anchoring transpeptidase ErfK/SrfK
VKNFAVISILIGAFQWSGFAQDSAPATAGEPAVAKAQLANEREIVTRLQIFLDQQNFGPGKIDGRWGEFTGKAVAKYAKSHGLAVTQNVYSELPLDSVYPVYSAYTLQETDLQWIGPTASKPAEQAKLKKLLYGDALEFVSERYHSDPEFLRKINPGVNLDKLKPGDTVRVPNVAPFKIEEIEALAHLPEVPEFLTRSIRINRRDHMLTLFDGEKILAAFPITPGSDHTPTPPGDWKVVGITSFPNFRWDEGVLNHGVRTEKFFMLPPGPNNPVGVAWTALSKPGIGIHGTNNPDTIGRAASHGCMRLANWDAVRFAYMVTKGVKATIE